MDLSDTGRRLTRDCQICSYLISPTKSPKIESPFPSGGSPVTRGEWLSLLKPYQGANTRKSTGQFALTLTLYLVLFTGMIYMVLRDFPYRVVLLAALPTAGIYVKLFIILHDCGHGSYFKSTRACTIAGGICGVLTFTPYYDWRRTHAIHHATVSNLERRGVGDVWTMTVEEYRSSPRWTRIRYRVYRSPLFLLGIAPSLLFLVSFRMPLRDTGRRCLISVLLTDLAIAVILTVLWLTIGFSNYVKVMLPIFLIAGVGGVWLFFIQHQYRNVYWSDMQNWDSVRAAMEGSSFYKLPGILRWFSGNIGYHHIHHLNPRIPNYNLRRCYREIPELREITPITVRTSLHSLFLQLWDEKTRKLVNFRALHRQ